MKNLTEPSEIARTAHLEIGRENVRLNRRTGDHEAKERELQVSRKYSGKPEPKRFRKTLF